MGIQTFKKVEKPQAAKRLPREERMDQGKPFICPRGEGDALCWNPQKVLLCSTEPPLRKFAEL